MKYTLLGLVLATVLGVSAVTTYGHEVLLREPWIEITFWWLIGSGVALDHLSTPSKGLLKRLCAHLPRLAALCDHGPTASSPA